MDKDKYIIFGNDYTSIKIPNFDDKDLPRISTNVYAFKRGEENASKYSETEMLEMLENKDSELFYEAFGAIGKRKLKKALAHLKNIALYDEDVSVQQEAICTIRSIGGRNALDILRFLKTTEHKDFVEEILLHGVETPEDYY